MLISDKVTAQPQESPQLQDSLGTMVCGDLNSFLQERQMAYKSYKNGVSGELLNQENWNPAAVFQCGSFTIHYQDIEDNSDGGFAHPTIGEARRSTLCAVLKYIESIFDVHPNANPTIHVLTSFDDTNPVTLPTTYLGLGGSFYSVENGSEFGNDPGVYQGFFSSFIQTGIDQDADFDYDASLLVNFDKTITTVTSSNIEYFNLNDPLENVNKYDLFTLLLHEVGHMMGISSAIQEHPLNHEAVCGNFANSFTTFDWIFGYLDSMEILPPSRFREPNW